MRQLSSGWTLVLRIFIPTIWISFFGTFLLAVWFSDKGEMAGLPISGLRLGLTAFVAVFIFIMYKTLLRLKRVDADADYFYITNYFKTVRYKHEFIKKIEINKGLIFNYGILVLSGKATFGDRIVFIASRKRLELFISENPHLAHLCLMGN